LKIEIKYYTPKARFFFIGSEETACLSTKQLGRIFPECPLNLLSNSEQQMTVTCGFSIKSETNF
jgi:hypothetical protein